jgi:glycosyltransferase involved in cell wall biosynthesis
MAKRLSIITVNRNNADGLRQTIQSVACQTFSDFEYIVIDGASEDKSLSVINENAASITWKVSEPDRGTYHAMNKGIAAATGEYCLFLNSGDFLIEKLVLEKLFASAPEADIVSCNVLKIRPNNQYRRVSSPEAVSLHRLCIHSLPHQATLIRRELFKEIGMYTETFRIASDWEFFLKALVTAGKSYSHIDLDLSFFRIGGISSRSENIELSRKESYTILKELFPYMADDLMEFRNFNNSNLGQMLALLKKHERLYRFADDLCGSLIGIKKRIAGK